MKSVEEFDHLLPSIKEILYSLYGQYIVHKEYLSLYEKGLSQEKENAEMLNDIHKQITGVDITLVDYSEIEQFGLTALGKKKERKRDTRFWRDSEFEGWKVYVLDYITNEERFVSLRDLVEMTGEDDKLEKKALQSAISNAITSHVKAGTLLPLSLEGSFGRYYGLPTFFQADGSPAPFNLRAVRRQFSLEGI